jgi:putative SOS response-associated peptidase YedK
MKSFKTQVEDQIEGMLGVLCLSLTLLWEPTFAILTGEPNEQFAEIHERMRTFLEPRDYEEYLGPAERTPVYLLRILPAEKMRVHLIENGPIANTQANLFDTQ